MNSFWGLGSQVNRQVNSSLYRLDPRVKVVALGGFLFLLTLLTSRSCLLLAASFLLFLTVLTRLQFCQLLGRLLWIFPFAGVMLLLVPFTTPGKPLFTWQLGVFNLAATEEGLNRTLIFSLRLLGAILALNLIVATTNKVNLLRALSSLGVPVVLLQITEFALRYIFVVGSELERMKIAREARGFMPGKHLFHRHTFRSLGQAVAVLFIRSWERGEQVYRAMLARGYGGDNFKRPFPPLGTQDLAWGISILLTGLALLFCNWRFWGE